MEPTSQTNPEANDFETDEFDIDLGDETPDDEFIPGDKALDAPGFESVLETTDDESNSVLKQSAESMLKRFPVEPYIHQEEYVEPDVVTVKLLDEEILHVPFRVTTSNPSLTIRLSAEIEQQSAQLIRRREAITQQLKRLNAQADITSRAMTRHERQGFGKESADIQAYLRTQNKVRADKVRTAQAFLKGTNAKAVAGLLNPRSKLDQVMNQKRSGTGGIRKPQPLMPK